MRGSLYCATFYCVVIFAASQNPSFTCDPAADCATFGQASKVPDPNDCEKYYLCISVGGQSVPSTSSIKCSDGQYFDQLAKDCAAETTPGTCGPNTCPIHLCESECPFPYMDITFVADKYECGSYYICLQTGPLKVNCPSSTPYFDGTTCVADASQCCDFCTAYCPAPGTQIVDPCDCTSYYICLTNGTPSANLEFSCAPGTFYDETTASCQSGTCSNICSSCEAVNPTVATSPTESTTTTTSSITTSSITTPTTPIAGCSSLDSFTCPRDGNFQICPYCYKYYFNCSGGTVTIKECDGSTVFNPNDQYPYCLIPSNCPYP